MLLVKVVPGTLVSYLAIGFMRGDDRIAVMTREGHAGLKPAPGYAGAFEVRADADSAVRAMVQARCKMGWRVATISEFAELGGVPDPFVGMEIPICYKDREFVARLRKAEREARAEKLAAEVSDEARAKAAREPMVVVVDRTCARRLVGQEILNKDPQAYQGAANSGRGWSQHHFRLDFAPLWEEVHALATGPEPGVAFKVSMTLNDADGSLTLRTCGQELKAAGVLRFMREAVPSGAKVIFRIRARYGSDESMKPHSVWLEPVKEAPVAVGPSPLDQIVKASKVDAIQKVALEQARDSASADDTYRQEVRAQYPGWSDDQVEEAVSTRQRFSKLEL